MLFGGGSSWQEFGRYLHLKRGIFPFDKIRYFSWDYRGYVAGYVGRYRVEGRDLGLRGFPKLGVSFEALIMGIIVFWRSNWGPLFMETSTFSRYGTGKKSQNSFH